MGAKTGDTVKVHYRGTLQDGTEFDSSAGSDPIEFTVGSGQVIDGFEAAVTGLEPGGKTTAVLPPDQAYGERNPQWSIRVPADQVRRPQEGGGSSDPEVGDAVTVMTQDGPSQATISAIEGGEIELDFNHPLAGETLTFEIELVEIVEA